MDLSWIPEPFWIGFFTFLVGVATVLGVGIVVGMIGVVEVWFKWMFKRAKGLKSSFTLDWF